jgi:hypothetical protein
MLFDFSAAEHFLSFLDGKCPLQRVLDHPAYQAVFTHADRFTNGLDPADVENALAGKGSPFYGLHGLRANRARIHALLEHIRENQSAWTVQIDAELKRIFPAEFPPITIYPILGYDMGIGLENSVVMNCNWEPYLNDPREFLYYSIHECVHVLYEHTHEIKPLNAISTPADWQAYFNLWFQNEGFAVYAPLRLRLESGSMNDRDYRVLNDPAQIAVLLAALREILQKLGQEEPLSREEYLECCFGDRRITYRMGCELIRRIEAKHGMEAVREAFLLPAGAFMERYRDILQAEIPEI